VFEIYIYTIQKQVVSYIHNSFMADQFHYIKFPTHNHPLWESQHSNWMSSCELQPITFNLHYISNLLVSIRYPRHGLSLTQWFCCALDEKFIIVLYVDEKRAFQFSLGMMVMFIKQFICKSLKFGVESNVHVGTK
jgi:hypothetical protein